MCCSVELAGKRYVLTSNYALQAAPLDHPVVSPAVIDGGDPKKPIASLKFVYPRAAGQPGGGAIALALLEPHIRHANVPAFGLIREVAPPSALGAIRAYCRQDLRGCRREGHRHRNDCENKGGAATG